MTFKMKTLQITNKILRLQLIIWIKVFLWVKSEKNSDSFSTTQALNLKRNYTAISST